MKRLNMKKIIHAIFSFTAGLVLLAGCGDNSIKPVSTLGTTGTTTTVSAEEQAVITALVNTISQKTAFLLTDAPSDDFQSVVVDVLSPIVVTMEGGATIDVPLPEGQPIRVDLLELDEISDHLAFGDLPAGRIKEVRLKVANPEVIKLDGTLLDTSKIDLPDGTLMITPNPPIDIVTPGDGTTVEIDVDVENSISVNVATTSDRLIFRPRGSVRKLVDAKRPEDEREAKRLHGTIAEIPINREHPKSFLLKHRGDRRHFIPVDASASTTEFFILEGDTPATTTFEALKQGQKVGVAGIWSQRGFLKARKIFILPEDHLAMRGVITHLNLTENTFDLVFMHHRDRDLRATTTATRTRLALALDMATSTDTRATSVKVHIMARTKILLDGPHGHVMELETKDLTNGQWVGVHGVKRPDSDLIHAAVIVVHMENFRAFVAEKRCDAREIRVVKPLATMHRLHLAGIVLAPENSGIVEFTENTRFIGLGDARLTCADLKPGMAIRIFGRMIPHTPDRLDPIAVPLDPFRPFLDPNPIRVRAFMIKRLPDELGHVRGVVTAVKDLKNFTLKVPVDRINGFDRLDTVCENKTETDRLADPMCFFPLPVTLMDKAATYTPVKDDHIVAAGVFHGHATPLHVHFHAFAASIMSSLPTTAPR